MDSLVLEYISETQIAVPSVAAPRLRNQWDLWPKARKASPWA